MTVMPTPNLSLHTRATVLADEPQRDTRYRDPRVVLPKGERAAFFAPKTDWLPRNEQVALALGKAQIAARRLDDARITVLSAKIIGGTAILVVDKAPDQALVQGAHLAQNGQVGRALLGEDEHAVLVEWAL